MADNKEKEREEDPANQPSCSKELVEYYKQKYEEEKKDKVMIKNVLDYKNNELERVKESITIIEKKIQKLEHDRKTHRAEQANLIRLMLETEDETDRLKTEVDRLSGELSTTNVKIQTAIVSCPAGEIEALKSHISDVLDEGDALAVRMLADGTEVLQQVVREEDSRRQQVDQLRELSDVLDKGDALAVRMLSDGTEVLQQAVREEDSRRQQVDQLRELSDDLAACAPIYHEIGSFTNIKEALDVENNLVVREKDKVKSENKKLQTLLTLSYFRRKEDLFSEAEEKLRSINTDVPRLTKGLIKGNVGSCCTDQPTAVTPKRKDLDRRRLELCCQAQLKALNTFRKKTRAAIKRLENEQALFMQQAALNSRDKASAHLARERGLKYRQIVDGINQTNKEMNSLCTNPDAKRKEKNNLDADRQRLRSKPVRQSSSDMMKIYLKEISELKGKKSLLPTFINSTGRNTIWSDKADTKNEKALLDSDKGQKSFLPTYLNSTGRNAVGSDKAEYTDNEKHSWIQTKRTKITIRNNRNHQ